MGADPISTRGARFRGRRLIVFGGGNGIGLETVQLLLEEGARVVLADRNETSPKRVEAKEPDFLFVAADATDEAKVEGVFAAADAAFGGVDGVLTTVGGSQARSFESLEVQLWREQIEFNLTSAFLVSRAALPHLAKAGGGSLVLTSSGFSVLPSVERLPYVAAKAGVNALARSLAMVGAPDKVRVNAVAPGPTDTARFRSRFSPERIEEMRKEVPLGEIPTSREVADTILFLLSDDARQITGQVLHVNGGLVLP